MSQAALEIVDMELRQEAVRLLNEALVATDEHEDAAWKAYDDLVAPDLLRLEDGPEYLVCSATGAPIWEHEGYVIDPETGEVWLRAAIGLPPRQEQTETEDVPE